MIGSGSIVSLIWAMSQLGWIAGPVLMLLFSIITHYTSLILAAAPFESVDLGEGGARKYTYVGVVGAKLSGFQTKLCGAYQFLNLYEGIIGYTIYSSRSMNSIFHSREFHHPSKIYMVAFGAVEIILSQIPNFDQIWWLSILSAIMSLIFSTAWFGLAVVKIAENGELRGSLTGIIFATVTTKQKIFRSFQALGAIIFSYTQCLVIIEIQDTIRSPPSEAMKTAMHLSQTVTTSVYMLCACAAYAAFGDSTPQNLISDFENPYHLVDFANIAIVIHDIGAYQVYSRVIFAFVEKTAKEWFPNSQFINQSSINPFRVVSRSIFVLVTTLISMLLPSFNDIARVLGVLGIWRLSIYYPVRIHILQNEVPKWSPKWVFLQIMSMTCLLISLAAFVGTVAGLV
ncbi:hypothetical protein ACS0TY_027745 [Phlomoides rotata]